MFSLIRSKTTPASWKKPHSAGTNIAVDEFPSVLLVGTTTLVQRYLVKPVLDSFDLGIPEWRLLAYLKLNPESSLGEITRSMWMDKAQINRALLALTDKNFVTRQADPRHGSRLLVRLTSEGAAAFDAALKPVQRTQAELLQALDPLEREALYSALAKLRDLAEERSKL